MEPSGTRSTATNQYELPLLYMAQRMEAERHHARLRAEAERGIDAPRTRAVRPRTAGVAGRPGRATRPLRTAHTRRGPHGGGRRTPVIAAGAGPRRRGAGVRALSQGGEVPVCRSSRWTSRGPPAGATAARTPDGSPAHRAGGDGADHYARRRLARRMIARSTPAPEPLRCPQRGHHGQDRFVMPTLAPCIVLLLRGGRAT
jgi:hypothetical protein